MQYLLENIHILFMLINCWLKKQYLLAEILEYFFGLYMVRMTR